jgi:CBS domain-containing protein
MPIVRDIMTVDIKTANPNTTLEEVASMMRDEDVGAIPILKEEELVGIVNGRDIVIRCIAEGNDPAEMTADAIVTEELETIDPDADVQEAARIMAERQVRRLPVVEDGRLAGMISLGGVAVKHADGRVSGEALRNISEGVKPGAATTARKTPVYIAQGRRAARRKAN